MLVQEIKCRGTTRAVPPIASVHRILETDNHFVINRNAGDYNGINIYCFSKRMQIYLQSYILPSIIVIIREYIENIFNLFSFFPLEMRNFLILFNIVKLYIFTQVDACVTEVHMLSYLILGIATLPCKDSIGIIDM